MQSVPNDYPITGLCVVSDPIKCPPGYEVIYRSHDRQDDCDLWKDSFFRSKVTRYLCYTRQYPLANGTLNNVLADVVINNERDPPPPGYSLLEYTVDTNEKATRKKQICVQMLPRATTRDAICEVILLSKSRRAPSGFTLCGELNSLMFCFKMNKVPPETQNGVVENNSYQMSVAPPTLPQASSPGDFSSSQGAGYGGDPSYCFRSDTMRRQESLPTSYLAGVPFQLSSHFQLGTSSNNVRAPELSYRSYVDIDNEYNYPFRIERSALQDS